MLKQITCEKDLIEATNQYAAVDRELAKTIHQPKMSSARRLIRNENLLKDYKNRVSYAGLAQKYGISERWARELCKSLLNKQ